MATCFYATRRSREGQLQLEDPSGDEDQIGRKLRPGGRLVLDIYHRGFFEHNQGTRHFERAGRTISESKRMYGDRLTVTLDYGPDLPPDVYTWQLFSPAAIAELARQSGFACVLACAGFDQATSASAELARMQLVFERSVAQPGMLPSADVMC